MNSKKKVETQILEYISKRPSSTALEIKKGLTLSYRPSGVLKTLERKRFVYF